jgi:hypothetical protein
MLASAFILLVAGGLACSQASRTLTYSSPSPEPGVVYVAEQVYGLDDWARNPASKSYARVTDRAGKAEEGPLVRITSQSVVIAPKGESGEMAIAKDRVLFMRVWW